MTVSTRAPIFWSSTLKSVLTAVFASRNAPVNAIYAEDELPEEQKHFLDLNIELSQEWPVITEMKPAPEDADDWKDIKEKLQYLER